MLDSVKLALRIKTDAFDTEIQGLIDAALLDLGIAGVERPSSKTSDALIIRAVTTFCKLNFGDPSDPERLKTSYDEQKAQLRTATGYTDWMD